MKTINEISDIANLTLSKQKISTNEKYRFLTYIMKVPVEDGTLLHNFLTGQTLLLNEEEVADFNTWKNKELFEFLVESWMLVTESQNERFLYDLLFQMTKLSNQRHNICSFTIFPTTDCNARCFYCFENGKKRYSMTEKTALDVAKYIIKVSKGSNVHIQWFGGEPLYNLKVIEIITNYLLENNVKLLTTMISNGYLFDEELIIRAKNEWNLDRVQITLDGTRDIYNRVKNYIYDDPNPFNKVVENIKLLIKYGVKVYIRINLEKHNIADMTNLIDFIGEEIGPSPNLLVYTWLLYDSRLSTDKKRNLQEKKELTEKQIELSNRIKDKKLRFIKPIGNKVITKACMAEDEAAVIILPNGKIGKCDHYLESNFIGDIYSNTPFDPEIMKRWKEKRPEIELCKTCCIFPYCRKLKNCPEFGNEECDEIEQSFYVNHARQMIVASYEKYLMETATEEENNG